MWGFKRSGGGGEWGRRKKEKLALFPDEGETGWCFKVQPGKATSGVYFFKSVIE